MRIAILPGLFLLGAVLAGAPSALADAERPAVSAPSDLSSQQQPRARTRITVRPAGRVVRQCDFRLVREVRASGTYVVPWQRCWWTRQR